MTAQKTSKRTKGKQKPIRVGVVGVGRGQSFAKGATDLVGMKLVALCDTWEERLNKLGKELDVATYTDFDKFLEHDMDAVVLANYFHEHTPFAIKALEAGYHVMSECACNSTLAEGVALCRAVEKSKKIYMLAENYPFTKQNMEMRRLYRKGEIGDVTYAEGEYNHPATADVIMRLSPGVNHWRNLLPSTYYCTHALAPLMYITNTMPTKINGLSITLPEMDTGPVRQGDAGSVILCRMDNGAVFRLFGLLLPGHSYWYRVHGSRGAMEVTRGHHLGGGDVRVWRDAWLLKEGEEETKQYQPDWPKHGDLATKAGHGGGDFWTNLEFANAIRSGRQPFLNVYRGVAMSSVGIQAWKSALEDGVPFDMPDWKKETSRKAFENDHWSPFPKDGKPGDAPSSILGEIKPTRAGLARVRKIWKEVGYRGG